MAGYWNVTNDAFIDDVNHEVDNNPKARSTIKDRIESDNLMFWGKLIIIFENVPGGNQMKTRMQEDEQSEQ